MEVVIEGTPKEEAVRAIWEAVAAWIVSQTMGCEAQATEITGSEPVNEELPEACLKDSTEPSS